MLPCRNCGTEDASHFYETQGSRYCKPCHIARYFDPGRARLLEAKLARECCVDCKLVVTAENACVMDWDHLSDKKWNVGKMTSCSLSSFNAEIAKCELVCAVCHRLRTQARGRTWAKGGRPRKAKPTTDPSSET